MIVAQWLITFGAALIVVVFAWFASVCLRHFGIDFSVDHILIGGLVLNAIFNDVSKVEPK